MDRIKLPNGGIEYRQSKKDKEIRDNHKGKKAGDLSSSDVKELVYELAKRAGII